MYALQPIVVCTLPPNYHHYSGGFWPRICGQLQIPRCLVVKCKLSFQTHSNLQSKIKSRTSFLFHNKASFLHAAKHTLVKLTILSILDVVIYKIASNTLLNKLNAVYHSTIRFVTKAPYTTHRCDLYALVGWPSLHICRQTQVIYRSVLGKAPPYLSSLVTIAAPVARAPAGIFHWSSPKPIPPFGRLSFQFCCQWLEWIA